MTTQITKITVPDVFEGNVIQFGDTFGYVDKLPVMEQVEAILSFCERQGWSAIIDTSDGWFETDSI
jgi:hypothetical protein